MKTIKINSENGFYNLEDLPHNCIFNKKVCGCGATTTALFNNESYIIAVPTTELIVNKTNLSESGVATITNYDGTQVEVFGLFGTFTYQSKKQLREYGKRDGLKKIMCTYDKLSKVSEFINPKDYRLLVDEYHVLLKAYSYREKAISGVINCFKEFKSYCFMSATPISVDFTPSALEGIDLVEAEWNETDTLLVKLDKTNKPYMKAANYINAYKQDGFIEVNGVKSYEAFFFINSVTDIRSILNYCELSDDEVKIVCADNDRNRETLDGYTISNSRSENKPFTFITSKSFEGADYFSETALCFVVSNSMNKNTLTDISTDIYQIAGRIRTETNPFRNMLIHIFNTTGKRKLMLDVTYEEMINKVNDNISGANEIISFINNSSDKAKSMAEKMINSEYVIKENDTYTLNDMIVKLDLFTYKLEKMIYSNGIALKKEYNRNQVLTTDISYEKFDEVLDKAGHTINFRDAFNQYAELVSGYNFDTTKVEALLKAQPLIGEAYNKLGVDTVKKLRYNKTAISNAIINTKNDLSVENKLAKMISSKIKVGFITSKEAKRIIKSAYDTCGITTTAKASDLDKWFDVKETSKRIDDKKVRGYDVYAYKFIVK